MKRGSDEIVEYLLGTATGSDAFFRYLHNSGQFIDRWHGSVNVVFGAILSAYAGISLTKTDQDIKSGILLSIICLMHVLFLWMSSEYHVIETSRMDEIERILKEDIHGKGNIAAYLMHDNFIGTNRVQFGIAMPIVFLGVAGFVWANLFGNERVYFVIAAIWYVLVFIIPFFIKSRVSSAMKKRVDIDAVVDRERNMTAAVGSHSPSEAEPLAPNNSKSRNRKND